MQEGNNAKDTIEGKQEFEAWAAKHGVQIEHIHADNGIFAAKEFIKECTNHEQTHSFCGVGAHWQNGIAERHIGVIANWARTLLTHAMQRWPAMIDEEFWPFAIHQAVNVFDATA